MLLKSLKNSRLKNLKKGNANSAAILIIIIALLIMLYILFLPGHVRTQLLDDSVQTGPGASSQRGDVLLKEQVGLLSPKKGSEKEHSLPSTTVFTQVNTEEIKAVPSLYIKNSLFSKEESTINFKSDLSKSSDYKLSFNVKEGGGRLKIYLNGHLFFNEEISESTPDPIEVPKNYLESENNLTFAAGGVGWAFWLKNSYQLENVLVSADVADYSKASSEQHFSITKEEYNSVKKARLEFVPDCDPSKTGRLEVFLNRNSVFSGLIDCGIKNEVEVDKELLKKGDNTVGFVSNQGSFVLSSARVVTELKDQQYPVYYFTLPRELAAAVKNYDARIALNMRFATSGDRKVGEITVNGYKQTFDTEKMAYEAVLDPKILLEGPNTVMIAPQSNPINVAEITVSII